jgi:hypothetical protein
VSYDIIILKESQIKKHYPTILKLYQAKISFIIEPPGKFIQVFYNLLVVTMGTSYIFHDE